ncbi:DUF4174 domain-containing protein [Priestia megaterium]|uniref:hypothetical protein n=1 Tax=Priestia megaterium TaxID=1404 RepID=UPI0039E03E72
MENQKFNFTNMKNIYFEALKNDQTLIFEISVGRGRFLFMMFFSEEDKESKDKLFIYLRNTKTIIKSKLYGSHKNGDFLIYINNISREKLINELQLRNGKGSFNFENFLNELNSKIPNSLSINKKIQQFRENWDAIKELSLIDEEDKTILIGERRLPQNKKPKETTLRKLYLYTSGSIEDISELIRLLKKANMTVAWTNEKAKKTVSDLREIINRLQ